MKLTLQNTDNTPLSPNFNELNIKFFYPNGKTPENYGHGRRAKPLITGCTILAGEPFSGDNQKSMLASEKVGRFSVDTPNLVLARTLALVKALYKAGFNVDDAVRIMHDLGVRIHVKTLIDVLPELYDVKESIKAIDNLLNNSSTLVSV